MRQYFQGTLDFACALYALLNALALLRRLDLSGARDLFQGLFEELPSHPVLWRAFLRNETDHYWLVRHCLGRWRSIPSLACHAEQPFASCLLPLPGDSLGAARLHLPEAAPPRGPSGPGLAAEEAGAVWAVLASSLAFSNVTASTGPVALFRFHRFLPGMALPVVSHWTCACLLRDDVLHLRDASCEKEALHRINKRDCLGALSPPPVRIVPESLLFLRRASALTAGAS
ncbi:MAG: hypothetical protein LBO77_08490 [Desulfovibrio sp.]|jgi:hypothetical protein|nr:hypothetical protein [Desulfovibrio sp.]